MSNVDVLIAAAQLHGLESKPDHEVGDLQDILRVVWEIMNDEQRLEALRHKDVVAVLEWGG